MKLKVKQAAILALAVSLSCRGIAQTPAAPAAKNLIIPGKSVGDIQLGEESGKVEHELGAADDSEGVMGGRGWESWQLGLRHGEDGHPFQNPGEISLTLLMKDYEHDSAAHPSPYLITQIQVTSPRFATAEGISPGASLDAIRAKYPSLEPMGADRDETWPLLGDMEFFLDPSGIGFAIRKRDKICIQIIVMPRGGGFRPTYPSPTKEHAIDYANGMVGDIKLGMTAAQLTTLLGQPDDKRDAKNYGEAWRWRMPAQKKEDAPALCVYLRKLPDGSLIVDQVRVSAAEFMVTDTVFPGCTLQDALSATPNIRKLDEYDDERVDIYGDLRAGVLFEVRQTDSICTAIAIFPPPLYVQHSLGGRWLDLPPQPEK